LDSRFAKGTLAILVQETLPFLQISNLFLGGCETFGKVPLPKSRPRFAKGTLAILVQETLPFLLIANLFLGGCETFGKVAFAKEPPPVCQRYFGNPCSGNSPFPSNI
jgi:hypothetical protein